MSISTPKHVLFVDCKGPLYIIHDHKWKEKKNMGKEMNFHHEAEGTKYLILLVTVFVIALQLTCNSGRCWGTREVKNEVTKVKSVAIAPGPCSAGGGLEGKDRPSGACKEKREVDAKFHFPVK